VLDCGDGCGVCGEETDAAGKVVQAPNPMKGKKIKDIILLLLTDPDVKAAVLEAIHAS
jgi:hypothetical protein